MANINACITTAYKSFIKDIKALLYTSIKYSLYQRIKGEDFPLL